MTLSSKIQSDLKTALLAGDKDKASVLKMLISSIKYEEINLGLRDQGLSDDKVITLLQSEVKKRQEAARMYSEAGDVDRSNKENYEVEEIENYLPDQMNDAELNKLVDEILGEFTNPEVKDMGGIIGKVKAKAGSSADGARIAQVVKLKLQ